MSHLPPLHVGQSVCPVVGVRGVVKTDRSAASTPFLLVPFRRPSREVEGWSREVEGCPDALPCTAR